MSDSAASQNELINADIKNRPVRDYLDQRFTDGDTVNKIITIPNLITILRIIIIPIAFFSIINRADFWAIIFISLAGITDFLDGFLARKLKLVTKVGKILDPIADRFFIFFIMFALSIQDIIPLWFFVAIIAREVVLFLLFFTIIVRGIKPPEVVYIGKVGAASLMVGMPLIYLVNVADYWHIFGREIGLEPVQIACFALLCVGLVLYYVSGVVYFKKVFCLLNNDAGGHK